MASDVVDEVPGPVVAAPARAGGIGTHARACQRVGDARRAGRAGHRFDADARRGGDPGHVRLVRHGVRKLLDAVAAVDAEAAGLLDRGLEFDYQRPNDKPDCRWRERAARERMLTRVAQDAQRALLAVEGAEELLADEAVAAAHRLLAELVGQDFDVDDDGVARLHRGTASGRIISTVDPEMRHGRKSQHQRFDGYKLSAAVTNTNEPLITAVDVAPASEQDGPQAKYLVDAQPPERRPPR